MSMNQVAISMLAVLLACTGVGASAQSKGQEKQLSLLLALTPEHFRDTATLKDDSLETMATITTVHGFQKKQGILKIVNNDMFLRAFIDKKTGTTKFQVYAYVIYYGSGWHFFNTVNYETSKGPETTSTTSISRDVGSCSQYLGCSHTEVIGFDVSEDVLRTIADKYTPSKELASASVWRFRFKGKSGQDMDQMMTAAEVKGSLMAVDSYKLSRAK